MKNYLTIISLLIQTFIFINCKNDNRFKTNLDSKNNNYNKEKKITISKDSLKTDTIKKIPIKKFNLNEEKIDGWLKIGLDEKKVLEKLNEIEHLDSIYFSEAEGGEINDVNYPKIGLKLSFYRISENESVLNKIEVQNNSKFKTSRNIAIGSKISDIKSNYEVNKNESSENIIVIGNVYEGLFFNLKGGLVNSYILGAIAE